MKGRAMRSLAVLAALAGAAAAHAAQTRETAIRQAVDAAIRPLMAKDRIPGMAVGVVVDGKGYVFDYGVASLTAGHAGTPQPVTKQTLFEIGSVSKTVTATLAALAEGEGRLSLQDTTSRFLPALRGTPFGSVTLLELGTHTPGGLPLQVPDNVKNDEDLVAYFRQWRPACPPGTCRTYSNIGIGTLGLIAAKSLGGSFAALAEQRVFAPLGMKNSFYAIPSDRLADYAQGYRQDGTPIRMTTGELAEETYGIRTTAADMVRFIEANLAAIPAPKPLKQAIAATHTGYFQDGAMTQDLIWEQYAWPVTLQSLLAGNSTAMILNATPVRAIVPPGKPRQDVWLNKTGSTNGFAAYVALVPEKKLGIVLLANKNYPIEDRVTVAYAILTALARR